ncbi:serine hydrolase [Microbacterium awajiense]|uniref:Serine hydrolase n=1 Tax=Microbacterium awajiense TaxID=415214 RepID=A0ABP7AQI0_9MICO
MSTPLEELLTRAVDDGMIPGAVAAVGRPDADPEFVAVGAAWVGGPPMRPDAIFRIQSMTKAVTAVATLRLVEAKRLRLDDPVERWLPELADRRVLITPDADLADTVPAVRPITVRHLLTNMSGYGMVVESPLMHAMQANGTYAGPEPVSLGADEWLARLAELPLAFQPGDGWRYHQSFGILGILLSRITGMPLGRHLREELFEPLGMIDTDFTVPPDRADRLPAAYSHSADGMVETEPAVGGFYVGDPPFDVSHAELVSTAADYLRLLRMLARGGETDGVRMLTPEHVRMMTTDQVPAAAKTPDSFFPGFWEGMGWGFGVGVQTNGAHAGRWGWSGGLGTDFRVDPDGTAAVLLTQVELGERTMPLLASFQQVSPG